MITRFSENSSIPVPPDLSSKDYPRDVGKMSTLLCLEVRRYSYQLSTIMDKKVILGKVKRENVK